MKSIMLQRSIAQVLGVSKVDLESLYNNKEEEGRWTRPVLIKLSREKTMHVILSLDLDLDVDEDAAYSKTL